MKHDNRNAIDFANEPVGKLFHQMLVPTLVGMISIVILNLTDGAFVGHGAGADSLAAINIAAPIFTILSGIGMMFGLGGSVVASIHLSKGEIKPARINVTQAFLGSVIITVIISGIMLCNLQATCRLFGSNEILLPLATSYLKWIAISSPLIILHMVGIFLIRLDGSPKYAMATSLAGTILNIFLDWLFIFPFGWGLEGAAKATSISFGIAGLMVLFYFVWMPKTLSLYRLRRTWKSFFLTMRNLGYQIRMGFSALLGEIAISGIEIAGNYIFVLYLGEAGVAAFSVACYCFPVIFMAANAIVESAQPIVSFAYGNGNKKRLKEAFNLMLKWSLVSGLGCSSIMFFGARYVAMLFLETGEPAYNICVSGLPLFSTGILFIILNVVYVGYLQSIECSTRASVYTLLRGFILVIPCFIFLPKMVGEKGMWLAIPIAEFLTLIVILATRKRLIVRKSPPKS